MKKQVLPMIIVFIAINALALVFGEKLGDYGIDSGVVIGGNCLLFAATLGAFFLYANALKSEKTHGFIGKVYGGFILKLVVLLAGLMAYFFAAEEINKGGLFVCMGLYLVYSFLGTSQVVKNKGAHHKKHH